MEIVRRLVFPLRVARTRLAARLATSAAVAGGVAVGVAALCSSFGGSMLVEAANLTQRLESVPPNERTVQVLHYGVVGGETSPGRVDAAARAAVSALTGDEPDRTTQFRVLRLGARRVVLTAIDDLETAFELDRGRWPRRCTPARCELVVARGSAVLPRLDAPFVVVGRAHLRSRVPFGRLFEDTSRPSGETLGAEPPAAIAVAAGARELAALPALASIYRTYSWVARVRPDDAHPWNVGAFARSVAQRRSTLHTVSDGFEIVAPVDELIEAADGGRTAARHLQLLGGEAAALVFAFALFVASTMRRQERAAAERLRWMGARQWQIVVTTLAHAAVAVAGGAVVGIAAGAGVTAIAARIADLPSLEVVVHAIGSSRAVAVLGASALAATAAFCIVLLVENVAVGGRRISPLDVAAAAAVAAVALAVGDDSAGAEGGSMLVLLPGLVLLAVAVVTVRALLPILRVAQPLLRHVAPTFRLAALSLARSEAAATAAIAFLVVSVAVAVFAVGYRETLVAAAAEQATYAVPRDFVVRERLGPGGLVPVLDAAPLERYQQLGNAFPALRQRGSVAQIVGSERVTVLGLPARELPHLDGWRSDFAPQPIGELARRLEARDVQELQGVLLPARATALAVPVRVIGADIRLTALLVDRAGKPVRVALGRTRGNARARLEAQVPRAAGPLRLIGLELGRVDEVEAHAKGTAPILRGILRLGALEAVGARGPRYELVDSYASWVGIGGARHAPPFGVNAVDFLIGGGEDAFFRVRQPTDTKPVSAAVTRSLATLADSRGVLSLRVPAGRLDLGVVATLRNFPTADGPTVVAEQRALSAALDTLRVGAGTPNEVWIEAPQGGNSAVGAALAKPPFDRLAIDVQEQTHERLRADPLARGTTLMLTAAATLALLLALVAVFVLAISDRRDRRQELLDLELQGMTPHQLRTHLRLRILLIALPAVVAGAAAGIVLAHTIVDFVRLTQLAAPAVPPIMLQVGWQLLLPMLGGFLVAAAMITYALTAAALRGRDAESEGA